MTLRISRTRLNALSLVREIGYRPLGYTPAGELNAVRPLGADYPRFHVYLKETESTFVLNLHLDQKRPLYAGTAAHGGEYDGETVQVEAARILQTASRF